MNPNTKQADGYRKNNSSTLPGCSSFFLVTQCVTGMLLNPNQLFNSIYNTIVSLISHFASDNSFC